MDFSWKDYKIYLSDIKSKFDAEQIFLPPDEYAEVMSEFNTHMSDEDRKHRLVTKPIGKYYYTISTVVSMEILVKHPFMQA